MASQLGYVGRIGNVIHYKMGDKFYSRAAPRKYKQTTATKAKAREFGKASSIGRIIRSNLDSVIPNPEDRKMQNRLVGVIFTWMQTKRDLEMSSEKESVFYDRFSFTSKGPSLRTRWKVRPEVNHSSPGLLQMKIPAFFPKKAIAAPAAAADVVCKIATVAVDVDRAEETGQYQTEVVFHYDDKEVAAQTIDLRLPTPQGSLIVTTVMLEYSFVKYDPSRLNRNKGFLVSEIIHAIQCRVTGGHGF
ncbi:MAG: hypothetical protein M3N30_09430 [Bacteroidota bacterium]|nr:hypothetical protein [Bacteroidota bacterium]